MKNFKNFKLYPIVNLDSKGEKISGVAVVIGVVNEPTAPNVKTAIVETFILENLCYARRECEETSEIYEVQAQIFDVNDTEAFFLDSEGVGGYGKKAVKSAQYVVYSKALKKGSYNSKRLIADHARALLDIMTSERPSDISEMTATRRIMDFHSDAIRQALVKIFFDVRNSR